MQSAFIFTNDFGSFYENISSQLFVKLSYKIILCAQKYVWTNIKVLWLG